MPEPPSSVPFGMASSWLRTIVFIVALLAVTFLVLMMNHIALIGSRNRVSQRALRARQIVDFSFTGDGSTLAGRLALRARPNKRLVHAMGIHNSLTTTDPAFHKEFLAKATRLLNRTATPAHWQNAYDTAEDLLQRDIQKAQPQDQCLNLGPLARRLGFRLVLQILLAVPPSTDCDEQGDDMDVTTVCSEINEQWVRSKNGIVSQSAALNSALARLLQRGQQPDLTPQAALALLLPAYETLWRVVLLTFVAACHRSKVLPDVLQPGRRDAIRSCLGTRDPVEKELFQISKEGLRLFPSSKRIYRAESLCSDQTIASDVEGLHRDAAIWGADTHLFRPARFDNSQLSVSQSQAYIPFGARPHLCPAYFGFGERMVAVLVVVLASQLGPEQADICYNDAKLDDGGLQADLPTDRMAMEFWTVKMKKQGWSRDAGGIFGKKYDNICRSRDEIEIGRVNEGGNT